MVYPVPLFFFAVFIHVLCYNLSNTVSAHYADIYGARFQQLTDTIELNAAR